MCELHTAATITNMYEDTCMLELRPTHKFFSFLLYLAALTKLQKRRRVSKPNLVIFVNEQDI